MLGKEGEAEGGEPIWMEREIEVVLTNDGGHRRCLGGNQRRGVSGGGSPRGGCVGGGEGGNSSLGMDAE
jgi:hypothetical protein